MKNWKWMIAGALALLVIFFLPTLYYRLWGYGPGMMMGYAGRGGMMSGNGFFAFGGLFAGLGMLLMWAVPLGALFLAVYGAVALFQRGSTSTTNTPPRATPSVCPSCGKPAEADWVVCPYCSASL